MVYSKPKVLFTDGEGPLVFKDLARDITRKLSVSSTQEYMFFDTLSMWVANNAETGQRHFEPGDTLATLIPHLLAHGITDEDLKEESKDTRLASGVEGYINDLRETGWQIRVISTAYEHLWNYVGPRLMIPTEHIASTRLNLNYLRKDVWSDKLSSEVMKAESEVVKRVEQITIAHHQFRQGYKLSQVFDVNNGMREVSQIFDELYFSTLPDLGFNPLSQSEVVGGNRKVDKVKRFANELSVDTADIVYVGDSITDDRAHKFVRENGGLAIAVNGDEFAIRNANVAVATEDMKYLKPLLEAFASQGIQGVASFVEGQKATSFGKERLTAAENSIFRYDLVDGQVEYLTGVHREFRQRARGSSVPIL